MTILIKQAEIIDSESPFHRQTLNIWIENGIINYIGTEEKSADTIIDFKNQKVSKGWFDMRATFGEPGFENKETIESGSLAASEGGFTGIALLPETDPLIQTKESVAYILGQAKHLINDLYPYSVVSKDLKGEELSEIMELNAAGAVGFTDATHPISHVGLLARALQYVQYFDGIIIQHPEEKKLSAFGQMNEGIESTKLGLKGIPHLAEEMIIQRDLQVLEYTGGKIHFSRISSKNSVDLIAKAKQKGLKVTCDVAVPNLVFTDKDLSGFDTNLKLNPPLRLEEDRQALWKGLMNDVIDAIVTDHCPQDIEGKFVAFDEAAFGMTNLETAFSALISAMPNKFTLDKLIQKLSDSPRKILNQKIHPIEVNSPANLTIFDTDFEWKYESKNIKSNSKNSPFVNKQLKGKALAIINKNKFYISQQVLSH